jgi:hypothetical protein
MSTEPDDPRAAVDNLLATLDPLAYPTRMRALAVWTRNQVQYGESAGGLRPLLDELGSRGLYGRRLAVFAAVIGGDAGFLEARLADTDATVRGHALKSALHLLISDAALERAMDDAPEADGGDARCSRPRPDADELVGGPPRVLRFAAQQGFGAGGVTRWYGCAPAAAGRIRSSRRLSKDGAAAETAQAQGSGDPA